MAEVLVQFAEPLNTRDGRTYVVQACGAPNAQSLWEGWLEFVPTDGAPVLRSARETTQPNKVDAEYWATGLTKVYLEGALERARHPVVRHAAPPLRAIFDGPAETPARPPRPGRQK